jgi:hypothetical protein
MDHLKINQRDTPVITATLIAYLKTRFKDTLPSEVQDSPHKVNFKIGQCSVIAHLESVMAMQEQEATRSHLEV